FGTQLARAGEGGTTVGPFEGGTAAHAGDGIDDETDLARGRGHGTLGMLRQAGIQTNDAGHCGQPLSALPGCSLTSPPLPPRIRLAPHWGISRMVPGFWQIADMERDGPALDPDKAGLAMAG